MGMTIERIIEIYNDYDRISGIILSSNSEDDSLFNSETIEAMNNINVILHKYQKIKEQVDIAIDKENFAISGARLIQIREIINGNEA